MNSDDENEDGGDNDDGSNVYVNNDNVQASAEAKMPAIGSKRSKQFTKIVSKRARLDYSSESDNETVAKFVVDKPATKAMTKRLSSKQNAGIQESLSNDNSNKKRMSASSVSSDASSTIKRGFKVVKGELITKNTISINDEPFYLFKFLINNESKEYYGDASQYHNMKENLFYEVSLNCQNRMIYIGGYKICKNADKNVISKKFLQQANFDSGDNVSVIALFKYGFKMMNQDVYKLVFHVKIGESLSSSDLKEIECTSNFKKMAGVFGNKDVLNENELVLNFYHYMDTIVTLSRVKCNQNNSNYKSLTFTDMTLIKECANFDENSMICRGNVPNVSRQSNKQILFGALQHLTAEHVSSPTTNQDNDRFQINYKIKDGDDESIPASFFAKNSKNSHKSLQKLETDLNQLNDLIESGIMDVDIYVIVDIKKSHYNVLGITKKEIDTNSYECL